MLYLCVLTAHDIKYRIIITGTFGEWAIWTELVFFNLVSQAWGLLQQWHCIHRGNLPQNFQYKCSNGHQLSPLPRHHATLVTRLMGRRSNSHSLPIHKSASEGGFSRPMVMTPPLSSPDHHSARYVYRYYHPFSAIAVWLILVFNP